MPVTTHTPSTERIRPRQEMTVRELMDHLLLERAKIDQQIEALKPFLGETEMSEADMERSASAAARGAAGQSSRPARPSGRTLQVAAFIMERLHKTRPVFREDLVKELARTKNIAERDAKEKVKSSLKDLTRRGRAVRGSEPGSYLLPKS